MMDFEGTGKTDRGHLVPVRKASPYDLQHIPTNGSYLRREG